MRTEYRGFARRLTGSSSLSTPRNIPGSVTNSYTQMTCPANIEAQSWCKCLEDFSAERSPNNIHCEPLGTSCLPLIPVPQALRQHHQRVLRGPRGDLRIGA